MNEIQQLGIEFIVALQAFKSPLLDTFFYLITQLGGFAYILVIPLLLWCIEPRLGLRALLAMLIAQYIVMLVKDIVQEPRPYLADTRIISDGEHGFSFPSGHAMGSLVFYGLLMLWTDKSWLRWLLASLIFFIGLSRNYLGVHYPHDVIFGWLMGFIYLWGWIKLQHLANKNLRYMNFNRQVLWSFVVPALVGTIHYYYFDYFGALVVAGAVSATMLSLILDKQKPLLNVNGTITQKTARYLLGIALTFGVLLGFRPLYPAEDQLLHNPLVWANGFAIAIMMAFIAPKLFSKIKLASP
ncbi:phosphatase PAP2 family protein [Oceanicoccus sp. KOV_DT_Chl]|uniref:phosphatase PAP2 family protein n=1 Tax=Oceanicoccus sp. KOV_DT_Chl TaxID=1904639 RepID=UPI000C7A67D7|nr:phosphatase PAP2 family protein [Oceanicoccus sp. KOV_DT_Chl]